MDITERRKQIMADCYTDRGRARIYGYLVGADTVILAELGATPEQIENYVDNKELMILDEYSNAFCAGYNVGKTDLTYYDSPMYNMYKTYLNSLIEKNAHVLQEWK